MRSWRSFSNEHACIEVARPHGRMRGTNAVAPATLGFIGGRKTTELTYGAHLTATAAKRCGMAQSSQVAKARSESDSGPVRTASLKSNR